MVDQPGVIPHLIVNDAAAALEFYKQALGATETMRMPAQDGKRLLHAEMEVNGAKIFMCDFFPEHCPGYSGQDKVAPPAVHFAGERYSIADIALYGYTHCAGEGDFSLSSFPAVSSWLARVASRSGHIPLEKSW